MKNLLAKYKGLVLTGVTIIAMCVISLFLGSSPKEIFNCAVTANPESVECKAMWNKDVPVPVSTSVVIPG